MSNALFLPLELFQPPLSLRPTPPAAATPRPAARQDTLFHSGEAVAADLMDSLAAAVSPAFPVLDRRRSPRPAHLRGVDFYIG